MTLQPLRGISEACGRGRRGGLFLGLLLGAVVLWPQFAAPGADPPEFQSWLADLRKEARAAGISQPTLERALGGLSPLQRVIQLDRSQPEFRLSLEQYLGRVVSEKLIAQGREKLKANALLLAELERRYGVPPRFLIALWGLETRYGAMTGGYPVIAATATLAYEGRRGTFFRQELIHALRILDEGHIAAEEMTGSWAGAMGQVQFMPSSFRAFGVDHNADGRIDIWRSLEDALASAANYLKRSGWQEGVIWGREVELPAGLGPASIGLQTRQTLSQWQAKGVRRPRGQDLPRQPDLASSIVQPDGPGGRAFVVYDNYRVILRWNRSHHFGIGVGLLADRIEEP